MRYIMLYKVIFPTILTVMFSVQAQNIGESYPEVRLKGTELRALQATKIDQNYQLWVSTPESYATTEKNYPVIYCLDAQWDFSLMVSLYGQLRADNDIPEAILVGITWDAPTQDIDGLRIRDFLPLIPNPTTEKHGAEDFLNFMDEQLFTYIEKEYRATTQRTLIGSSFAGWFSLYSLFQRPDLFSAIIATAPTVDLENNLLFKFTSGLAERISQYNTKLYVAVGDRDSNKSGVDKLVSYIKAQNFQGLTYESRLFENVGHSLIKTQGVSRGLQSIFMRSEIKLTHQQMQTLTGNYKKTQGEEIANISLVNNSLMLSSEGKYQLPLKAINQQHFYFGNYYLDVKFDSNKAQKTMRVIFPGGEDNFVRQ
jgi:hypothetical protein